MARVAIVGVGAIGGVTAALLQRAGDHQLLLCTRRLMSGLSVDTPDGLVDVHATFVTNPNEAFDVDWVIVATKAYDVAGAAKWLESLCSNGAPVAVLQNGVEHQERYRPICATGKDPARDGGLPGRTSGSRQGPAAWSDAFKGAGQRFGPQLRQPVCGNASRRDDGAGL